jgi:K+-transporting ATPase KdpF subunit
VSAAAWDLVGVVVAGLLMIYLLLALLFPERF